MYMGIFGNVHPPSIGHFLLLFCQSQHVSPAVSSSTCCSGFSHIHVSMKVSMNDPLCFFNDHCSDCSCLPRLHLCATKYSVTDSPDTSLWTSVLTFLDPSIHYMFHQTSPFLLTPATWTHLCSFFYLQTTLTLSEVLLLLNKRRTIFRTVSEKSFRTMYLVINIRIC